MRRPAPAIVIGAAALAAALFASDAHADPLRVCFAGLVDPAGEGGAPVAARSIDSAFTRLARGYTVVPGATWSEAADAAGFDLATSLLPANIAAIAGPLHISGVVVARVIAGDPLATRIELEALDPATGAVLVSSSRQVAIDFGAGAAQLQLSRQQADGLVREVLSHIRNKLHAPPAPPAPPIAATTPAPATTPAATTPAAATTPGVTTAAAAASTDGGRADKSEEDVSLDALALQKPDIKLGANAALTEWVYFYDEPDKVPGRHEILGALQVSGTAPLYTASVRLLARKDFGDSTRDLLEAEEAWVELGHWGLRLRAGRNIIVWDPWVNVAAPPGSPITPTDVRDIIRSEVLPVYNVRAAYDFGPATFELYYLPVPERNIATFVPQASVDGHFVSNSRWYVDGSFEHTLFKDKPIEPVLMGSLDPPPPSIDNAQGVARASLNLDWFRSYIAYGSVLSLNPVAVPGKAAPGGAVPVAMTYPREHLVDAAGAVTFGFFSAGGDLTLTAPPDVHSADAVATLALGLTSPLIADQHRFSGGVVVIEKPNLVPSLVQAPGDATVKSLLATTTIAYAAYSYGHLELKTIALQGGVTKANLLHLVQVKLRFGAVSAALALSTAWGAPDAAFGKIPDIDRVEMSLGAAL